MRDEQQRRAKMVRIFVDEADYYEGDQLHEAILKRLRAMNIAGATVFRGIVGYGGPQHLHHLDWTGHPTERPIMVTIVDTEEKIDEALSVIDEMVGDGLIVLSDVEVIRYANRKSKRSVN
jgi:PII-like signaling protein